MIKYGISWNERSNPVQIEMQMIRAGGHMTVRGGTYGEGLFHHYKALQKLLWTEGEDHHRWSDLMLQTILAERITAISGSRDSGKTHVALSRFGLTDYFVFPDETLILVSSTDLRGLRLRVWGDMVDMLKKAKERHPWLPGNVVESLHGIFTDKLSEDTPIRDIRKGIICIPCLDRKGTWVGGLEKFVGIKQKRRRLLGDECFPAGTMVDTPTGAKSIQNIKVGDRVLCASGVGKVSVVSARYTKRLTKITMRDRRVVCCTPEHLFFTQKGWIKACELNEGHYIMSSYETMRILQETAPASSQNVLRQCLLSELPTNARVEKEVQRCAHEGTRQESRVGFSIVRFYEGSQPDAERRDKKKGVVVSKGNRMGAAGERRQWAWSYEGGREVTVHDAACSLELRNKDGEVEWKWIPSSLQSRCGCPRVQTRNRSRWTKPQQSIPESQRRKENQVPSGAWVDSVQVLKQRDSSFQKPARIKGRLLDEGDLSEVFNLQVEGHPSYSVNGLLVHNCQFMHQAYLETLSNLDKGDFKGVFVGNALANLKALDKISEPVEGWGNHPDPTKTEVFKNRYGGVTITLVGTDSPNYDVPEAAPVPFPYLVDRKDEKSVGDRYGRNSEQYYSQIAGYRKPGLFAHRVLTQEMCEKGGAFKDVVWQGEVTTKVYACDMGFGGDRAVAGWGEFGAEVGGGIVFNVHQPSVIPISVDTEPEDQIALYIRKECGALGIAGADVFYDAGMKATAAVAMSKLFSPECNAVNFGGSPTKRPVSSDEYVIDRETGAKRLKRCDEHYIKFVTELWFSVRLTVMARQMRNLPRDVSEEFYLREWTKEKGDRYELEKKEDTKERTGVSPDLGDWLAILIEGARRLGFMIESLPAFEGENKQSDDYLQKELQRYQREAKKRRLSYT